MSVSTSEWLWKTVSKM